MEKPYFEFPCHDAAQRLQGGYLRHLCWYDQMQIKGTFRCKSYDLKKYTQHVFYKKEDKLGVKSTACALYVSLILSEGNHWSGSIF